jgi:hypothetical protein
MLTYYYCRGTSTVIVDLTADELMKMMIITAEGQLVADDY